MASFKWDLGWRMPPQEEKSRLFLTLMKGAKYIEGHLQSEVLTPWHVLGEQF